LGWGDAGRLARLLAGVLTFFAVVIAWVFFRADSITTASSMLSSMAGFNGLLEKWVPVREDLKIIIPCLALVWFFPNVRQMLITYKPTWEDMAGVKTPSLLLKGRFAYLLSWRLTTSHACILGLLFFFCTVSLTKVSEFLYFQF
jgi:alginate O-acetyltransferase complex protein AlgI